MLKHYKPLLFLDIAAGLQYLGEFLRYIPGVSTAYDRFMGGPDLCLEVNLEGVKERHGVIQLRPELVAKNRGGGAATETYIKIDSPTWDFETDDTSGLPVSDWLIDYDTTHYWNQPGRIHELNFDSTIPKRTSAEFFLGRLELEKNIRYELGYTIRCAEHGPKPGKIVFETTDDSVEISYERPNLTNWPIRKFSASNEQIRESRHIDPVVTSDIQIEEDTEHNQSRIVITTDVLNQAEKPITTYEVDVSVRRRSDPKEENRIPNPHRIHALFPTETWVFTHAVTVPELGLDVSEWTVDIDQLKCEYRRQLDEPRGIEKSEVTLHKPHFSDGGGRQNARLTGTLTNTNQSTSVGFWVHYRFKTSSGALTGVETERVRLEPQESYRFDISSTSTSYRALELIEDSDIIIQK